MCLGSSPSQIGPRQPLIVEAASRLNATSFVIDGEDVILDTDGVSDFDRKPVGPIVAVVGADADGSGGAPDHQAIAAVLDLVDPQRARGGGDDAGRQGREAA